MHFQRQQKQKMNQKKGGEKVKKMGTKMAHKKVSKSGRKSQIFYGRNRFQTIIQQIKSSKVIFKVDLGTYQNYGSH